MKPVAYFPDPFRGGDNIIVLTSTYKWADAEKTKLKPTNTNFRHFAEPIFEAVAEHEPWYGIEQEYTLFECTNSFTTWPLGWPEGGYPQAQGPYYCSVGATVWYGRIVMDLHYQACLAAGLTISGTNGETMPGQWEFQIGPSLGIEAGDHLWVARYLLGRVTEDLNIGLSFNPKPVAGDWAGAGGHVNFSTKETREEGGLAKIFEAVEKFEKAHSEHIKLYGRGNEKRLTGKNETCKITQFKCGVGDRTASIRIPTMVNRDGKGYLEDRRPASNLEPYVVTALMASTVCLDGDLTEDLVEHYERWVLNILHGDERKFIKLVYSQNEVIVFYLTISKIYIF